MAIPADGYILTGQRLLKGKRSIEQKSGGILKIDAAKIGEESKKEGRQGNCPPPLENYFAREAAAAL
jgi:hypothetical protein